MKIHPAAAMFPMMSEEDFIGLRNDIHANGQRDAIRVWRGMLIDGRNRHRACQELGTNCLEEPFHGSETDVVDLIVSCNLHRRHLTASQRAAIAVDMLPHYEAAAKDRMLSGKAESNPSQKIGYGSDTHERTAAAQAAKATGANRQYVADAKALKAASPDAFEAVRRGEVTLAKAKAQVREAQGGKPSAKTTQPARPAKGLMEVTNNVRDVLAPVAAALKALKGHERASLAYELIRIAEEALRA